MATKYPFEYKQGKVIYTIIDDASRWAFTWSHISVNADNTIDFVKKVISRAHLKYKRTESIKALNLLIVN
ncbi:MAG: hypothetical protein PHS45_02365 [Bacilli bacterium]|nr:hypothetical protein [Bacilli bacterium]